MMQVKGDRLYVDDKPVAFVPSPNFGGRIEPTLIVLHETADRLKPNDSVEWFKQKKSKVSAHFVIGRDGSIVQMVDLDRMAYHAGASEWRGRKSCNGFSIGIEIDNPGRLTPRKSDAVAWFGDTFPLEGLTITDAGCTTHGAGAWLPHTVEQLTVVAHIVQALVARYPSIKEVVGHFEISPGRKVDPNPCFPMAEFKALAPAGAGKPSKATETVSNAQRRLAELGYWHGANDGALGTLTRQAVRTFQEQNGLAISGDLDNPTLFALADRNAKAMPNGARQAMDHADVAGISTTLGATAMQRVAAAAAGGSVLGIANGPDSATVVDSIRLPMPPPDAPPLPPDMLTHVDGLVSNVEQARSITDRLGGLVHWVWTPRGLVILAVLACLLVIWAKANKIDWRRVVAQRFGFNLQSH